MPQRFEPIHPAATPARGAFAPALLVPARRPGSDPGPAAAQAVAAAARAQAERDAAAAAAAATALRAAHAAGHAEGLAEARAEIACQQEARAAAALEAIARALDNAAAAAAEAVRAATGEAAEALARLVLAALDAALPPLAAREAEPRIAALVEALLPALAEQPRLLLRVAPDTEPALAARFAADARIEVAADAMLASGDARLEWCGGSAEAVLETRRRAVRATLAALGLEG